MKKEIKKLELKKLFKEFGFLKMDEEYKNEIQSAYGSEFEAAVRDIFKNHPEVDAEYNGGQESSGSNVEPIESTIKRIGIEIYDPNNLSEAGLEIYTGTTGSNYFNSKQFEEGPKSDEVKRLYRKIATKTHPDKVAVKYLNDLYLKAKTAYQANDIFTLYLICNDLDIDYSFPKEEVSKFKITIKDLKNTNAFVEQTYLWAWINEEDEKLKRNILLHFIAHAYKPRI